MGCTTSVYKIGRIKKQKRVPEVAIFVPSLRIPVQSELTRSLRGLVPQDLVARLSSARNRIVLVAETTDGSAIGDLLHGLEEYLPVLIGLTERERGLEGIIEFKWKNVDNGRQEICVASSWFELLSVVHLMAVLTLSEANLLLIPKYDTDAGLRIVTADSRREAVDLLLKASGFLEFCYQEILAHLPSDIKKRLPGDLQEDALEAISIQVLGQATEIQIGLAVESRNASLSVKRRLACELLVYYGQAHSCFSPADINNGFGKKNLLFIKWKYLEAKVYCYSLLLPWSATRPGYRTIMPCFCCMLFSSRRRASIKQQKACLTFCLAAPVTRIPPLWGVMKHLHNKIPEITSKKLQTYGYLLEEEKALLTLPDLPEFQLSLKPEYYELPETHQQWDSDKWEIPCQLLKEHLKDSEAEIETRK